MSRSGQRDAHRRQQPRGNGHRPRSDHHDQRCVLGDDRRGLRLHQEGNDPCVTRWPVVRPGGRPYTGGRTLHRQRCAIAAVDRKHERSRQLVSERRPGRKGSAPAMRSGSSPNSGRRADRPQRRDTARIYAKCLKGQDKIAERRSVTAVAPADRCLAADARTCRIARVARSHTYTVPGIFKSES
jgi:hypothetical protein